MRLGVFTDALAHLSLGEALDWIERSVPDVRDVELGTGGYVSTFERLAALSPSVALNLDPSHFFWQSIDPRAVAVSWWGAFIDALRHGGYEGIVSIEHEDPDVTAEEGLVESAETLRRAIGKEGPASRALPH